MSYDYVGIVESIVRYRRMAYDNMADGRNDDDDSSPIVQEYLQKSVDSFTKFSQECPMTPMLWMQYALDSGAVIRSLMSTTNDSDENSNNNNEEAKKQGLDMQISILIMALIEFPGCVLLWRMYLEGLVQQHQHQLIDDESIIDLEQKLDEAFQNALHQVGRGSHRNQDDFHVAAIYRLYLNYCMSKIHRHQSKKQDSSSQQQKIISLFLQRASTPMKQANDTLLDEIHSFIHKHKITFITSQDIQDVEGRKRFSSKHFDILSRLETNVNVAMDQEGITSSSSSCYSAIFLSKEDNDDDNDGDFMNWKEFLKPTKSDYDLNRYLMGLGMMQTAQAFITYAKGLWNYEKSEKRRLQKKKSNDDENEHMDDKDNEEEEMRKKASDIISSLAISVYERGISECPTVEIIWEKYVQHLLYQIHGFSDKDETNNNNIQKGVKIAQLKNICQRAVRNCPYSVKLFKFKIQVLDLESNAGMEIFEPDNVMAIVNEAISLKFLPNSQAQLQIYMAAIQVVKNRILQLLSKAAFSSTKTSDNSSNFDEAYIDKNYQTKKSKKRSNNQSMGIELNTSLDEDTEQDVLDLVEDLRDMYDTADSFLRKNHSKWTKGRQILLYDRAQTEAHILSPLLSNSQDDDEDDDKRGKTKNVNDMIVSFYEKLVRVHQPPHPDAWLSYINYVLGRSCKSPNEKNSHGTTVSEISSVMTAVKLMRVRGLFQKAMSNVKKQKQTSLSQPQQTLQTNGEEEMDDTMRDYDLALWNLCHEYLQFEKTFGSTKSYEAAIKLSKAKITNPESINVEMPNISTSKTPVGNGHFEEKSKQEDINTAITTVNQTDNTGGKRKLSSIDPKNDTMQEDNPEPDNKRIKSSDSEILQDNENTMNESTVVTVPINEAEIVKEEPKKKTNLKAPKLHPEYKIKVGNLEYPAHPYTIHVSNLSLDTQDMDLVELFREKCGKIVFARILREKGTGKSKRMGLVQFEERESVDAALELDGIVGLHEKLINVKRSHMSALVSVVPPGLSRVNPKGEGRSTNRNLRRKEKLTKNFNQSKPENKHLSLKSTNQTMENNSVKPENSDKVVAGVDKKPASPDKASKNKKASTNTNPYILAFQPRAVSNKRKKPKVVMKRKDDT